MKTSHYKDYKNRKTKRYHFSYNFKDYEGNSGFGYAELYLNGKFKINEICEHIEKDKNYSNVIIISWQNIMK